jgi:hypothetical protein
MTRNIWFIYYKLHKTPLMKNLISTCLIFGLFAINCLAQNVITKTLEQNSVRATIPNAMPFFKRVLPSFPGYEVPKNSGNHTVFMSNFWFAGFDEDSILRSSLSLFRTNGDIFSGPYSYDAAYFSSSYANQYYNKIWKVTRDEIIYHIDNFQHPNYTMPESIADWPGNGDTTLGISWQLAPFVDIDGDGVYNPASGDYPCIKGDAAVYVIFNDDALEHEVQGSEKIGLEAHLMFYQINASDFIDTTTFINLRIFNRGNHNFLNLKTALYMDTDIGFAFDDYIGCDTNLNLGYGYNATNFDTGGTGASGYANNPPAFGSVILNNSMESFGYYLNGFGWTGDPLNQQDFWNYMNSKWRDGTPRVYGGNGYHSSFGATTQETNYHYSGNPYTNIGWTEMNTDGNGSANPADEDKRYFMTLPGEEFNSGDVLEYDFAFVFYNHGNHLENVQGLIDQTPMVQDYYDNVIATTNCEITGTGVPDPNLDNLTEDIIPYDMLFEITRLDGEGNMLYAVELHPSSEAQILELNVVDSVHYVLGKGPIYVSRIDTVNYVEGYYLIKTTDNFADTSSWTIYRYAELGGQLLDSVEANTSLSSGDTIYLNQYGLKVLIQQENYPCYNGASLCPMRDRIAEPIYSSINFSDPQLNWLTGVQHNFGFNPENWITSGNSNALPGSSQLGVNDPSCYNANHRDPNSLYSNLVNGSLTAGQFARINGCAVLPVQTPGLPIISTSGYSTMTNNQLSTVFHPSVDIVFTPDTSLWTRCAVIELNDDETTSQGGGKPGMLRAAPSVDKLGNPDGTGTGMSWFPGYAIDVETGRRLNMAFGENSTLTAENGDDMIWNPTSTLYDTDGNPVFGGQHVIYVFGGEWDNMPVYDEGEFIRTNLELETAAAYRAVYRNLSWVMQPLLNDGYNLLATPVRIRARINKEFKLRELSGLNDSRPMFGFTVGPYDSSVLSVDEELATALPAPTTLTAFPNPANRQLTVKWSGMEADNVQVYSMDGRLAMEKTISMNQSAVVLDVSNLKTGIYIVRVGEETRKIVIRR